MITLLDAMRDKNLFAPFFKGHSWATWRAIIAAIFAIPMTEEQLDIYRRLTGRTEPPGAVAKEVWLCIGRRGGKSRIISLIAVWLACFFDYKPYLAPGERGVVQIVAPDKKQARTCLSYVRAFLRFTPLLAQMIESENQESISLTNDITIAVTTASFRSARGFTVVAALLEEIAFFHSEDSANPDTEIVNAIKPAMATIPNAMLLAASSPYARRGVLYEAYKKHYGRDNDPVLVVQADTASVNPIIDSQVIADAYEADPTSAAAEYGALFRTDVESYIAREVVEACVTSRTYERAPRPSPRYVAFTDPSGGSSDSFTLAIAHRDADRLILDAVREVEPPFSPNSVCAEFADLLKTYGVRTVVGDRYAGLWPVEVFAKYGVKYEQSASPKSTLYQSLLPLLNSRRCELLDHARLVNQLIGLERRTARGGKDSIDHAPHAHDDIANAVAGVLTNIAAPKQKIRMIVGAGPGYVVPGVRVGGVEVDPATGKPLEPEWHHPLRPGPHHGCIPGKGVNAPDSLFNAQHGINNFPRRSR